MSHQRHLSHDAIKEPHSVSVKVLRLSCPSLVSQYPIEPPFQPHPAKPTPLPASLAYRAATTTRAGEPATTNPAPFLLSPILNLPASFGSAYVGETFSCTLCANNDLTAGASLPSEDGGGGGSGGTKRIRDVRIEAEMKTPGLGKAQKLELRSATTTTTTGASQPGDVDIEEEKKSGAPANTQASEPGGDLPPGGTLQKVVSFDLKEEGNHVLAVTVSYYEATDTSGRTRTFRKLYQFICKASLIVRTKVGVLEPSIPRPSQRSSTEQPQSPPPPPPPARRRWVLEAQLENCSEDTMQLDTVAMELEPGLTYHDCNSWQTTATTTRDLSSSSSNNNNKESSSDGQGGRSEKKPVLHPGEVEQVCFIVETVPRQKQLDEGVAEADAVDVLATVAGGGPLDARVLFGVLGIGWRGQMGNRGFLSTGKLGTRAVR